LVLKIRMGAWNRLIDPAIPSVEGDPTPGADPAASM
jgi:hypothetical protein